MKIEVEYDRPVTIKANGKTIKLTHAEAMELANKLYAKINYYPQWYWYPYYPYYPYYLSTTSDWTYTTNADGNTTAYNDSTTYTASVGGIEVT